MNVDRILHLYWRTKKKRVRKKNLTRFGKWMERRDEEARRSWLT